MICKNCNQEIQDNSRFCNLCGAEQSSQQNTQPEQPVTTVQETPVQEAPVQETPVQEALAPAPEPVHYQPQSANVPESQQNTQTVQPQAPVEKQPSMFQPMIDLIKGFDFKKFNPKTNPKPVIIAGSIVAAIVILAIVGNLITGSGINGLVNKMEDAINDRDVQKLKECYPDFMADDISSYDTSSFIGYLTDVKVDIDIVEDEDITDKDYKYDSSYTWQQHIQNDYTGYSEYDGEEVTDVKKVTLEYDIETGSSLTNFVADAMDTKVDMVFAKVDGDWVIYDSSY